MENSFGKNFKGSGGGSPPQLKSRLVLAGAGTGKTHRLIQETLKIWRGFRKSCGKDPRLIVCTFTRKATQELKTRLYEEALKSENSGFLKFLHSPAMEISTIDGILSRLLRRYGYQYGLNPDFVLSPSEENERLLNQLSEKLLFGKYIFLLKQAPFGHLKKALRFYTVNRLQRPDLKMFGKAEFLDFQKERDEVMSKYFDDKRRLNKNIGVSSVIGKPVDEKQEGGAAADPAFLDFFTKQIKEPGVFQESCFLPLFREFEEMAKEFFEEFVREKKQSGLLEMSDLVLFSLDLLRRQPAAAKAFAGEWDYWLIDEYQDTSWAQEQIIREITGFKNLFCVGDPKQSIYLFRGADPEVFKRRIEAMDEEETLDINYRSNSSLVAFFNDFFPKKKGYLSFSSAPCRASDPKKPCARFLNYGEKEKDAFAAVYYHIQRLLEEGNRLSEITVLSFKNKDLSRLALFLRARNIDLELHSAKGFSEKRLILDALFFLKFLINPYDDANLIALCRAPWFFLSDQTLGDLRHDHKEFCENQKPFWRFMEEKLAEEEEPVRALRRCLALRDREGFLAAFEHGLFERGLMDLSRLQDPSGSSESNLWKLLNHLRKASSPLDLLYSLEKETGEEEIAREAASFINPHALQMMTIHGSKGLQFSHVIIMDLSIARSALKMPPSEGDFALDRERGKMAFSVPLGGRSQTKKKCYGHSKCLLERKRALKQERDRLFYVAMTRARESLAFAIPSGKPDKNSWLKEVSFFRDFERIFHKEGKSGNLVESWSLKSGVYNRDGYTFTVENKFPLSHSKSESAPSAKRLAPFQGPPLPDFAVKSSKDFIEDLDSAAAGLLGLNAETNQNEQKKPDEFVAAKAKNLIFKMNLGQDLHHCLRLLSKHPLPEAQARAERSFLSESAKAKIKKALAYVSHLPEPKMSVFLKRGYAEWPFKIQAHPPHGPEKARAACSLAAASPVILQGQIDLWGWEDGKTGKTLYVFDYKSSLSQSAEKQLIFYSWALDFIYRPEEIVMTAVYPLDRQVKTWRYGAAQKELMDSWIKNLSENPEGQSS